jgi:hypothetical protein
MNSCREGLANDPAGAETRNELDQVPFDANNGARQGIVRCLDPST